MWKRGGGGGREKWRGEVGILAHIKKITNWKHSPSLLHNSGKIRGGKRGNCQSYAGSWGKSNLALICCYIYHFPPESGVVANEFIKSL